MSARPLMAGVVSLMADAGAGLVTLGVLGALVSTVKVCIVGAEILPAASVAVAVIVWLPSPSAVLGVQLQAPPAPAVAVQVVDRPVGRPSVTVMLLPASAVPMNVGVVSLVVPPAGGLLTNGALGAAVSTVKVRSDEATLVLPAVSAAVAVTVWLPSTSAVLGVQVQAPPLAIVLQI